MLDDDLTRPLILPEDRMIYSGRPYIAQSVVQDILDAKKLERERDARLWLAHQMQTVIDTGSQDVRSHLEERLETITELARRIFGVDVWPSSPAPQPPPRPS